jgi:nucleoid-associated protein YgaU
MFAPASLARILVLVVAVLLFWALFAGEGGANGPERHYRVKAGDTLWSIAAKTYAGDPREGVWELRERNRLDTATIVPGQMLVLPS